MWFYQYWILSVCTCIAVLMWIRDWRRKGSINIVFLLVLMSSLLVGSSIIVFNCSLRVDEEICEDVWMAVSASVSILLLVFVCMQMTEKVLMTSGKDKRGSPDLNGNKIYHNQPICKGPTDIVCQ
ncbi:uncharacterized protein LOC128241543 isoform X2 [Mya arenaria]|uniref:uncharacterized protein LOC128241543 isoform X2 n=1 Tax=Mya arenaria TaxID=6604 RepID=UPI0022E6BB24|nr:uncharacterized protein LOC128241543 isoform X2 [Mya arenaria]